MSSTTRRPLRSSLPVAALLLALPALGAACGDDTTGAGGSGTSGDEQEVSGPPRPWGDMSTQEKRRYMAEVVEPSMRPLFQEHDATEFADFGCETCHGADMADRHFDMPNPHLLALYPSGTPEQRQTVDRHPRMVRFMFNRVVPRMQRLLGLQTFDPATGQGFSCFYCHPRGRETDSPPATDTGATPPPGGPGDATDTGDTGATP